MARTSSCWCGSTVAFWLPPSGSPQTTLTSLPISMCWSTTPSESAVRSFRTFTSDLRALADWLAEVGIKTVAMESTGVYWIPVYELLEERGFEVLLVNARDVKNVPGRKTDVNDAQWLQQLHQYGLLRGSFRPREALGCLRAILRHRERMVDYAASHIQHMQKALMQMNVQLHHVVTDVG